MTLQSGAAKPARSTYPRFLDAGETALVVEFGDTVDPAINAQVLALDAALRAAPPKGAREFVPTYRSLMIHYEPLEIDRGELIRIARQAMAAATVTASEGATWIFPCCYEAPFSEDIEEAAHLLKLSRDELITLHTKASLRVYMYGFLPGFAYLGGVPKELTIPRRVKIRTPTPVGAVMIAGGQGVICSLRMQTGWYMIGRTPERMFDLMRDPPFLFGVGDELVVERIDAARYSLLAAEVERGGIVTKKI